MKNFKNNFFHTVGSGCCGCVAVILALASFSSCSDFLYDDSDQVIYTDDHTLGSDADTLWTMAGIMNKLQAIADRTVLLGEVRGDLVSLTDHASADLRELAAFSVSAANKYNQPRDYYAIINNCNYFIARADTALRNNRNEHIFLKEYAAAKAFRAWTYLQLVLNYGRVPFFTEPVLSMEDSEQDFPLYDLQQVCQYLITDIAPYAEIEMPGYESIRNTNSGLFYYPVYVLLGDLYLWSGQYQEAARSYYSYISTRGGRNSAYPISSSSVRFLTGDTRWLDISDSWSYACFNDESETYTAGVPELITVIPGDSLPSDGNYSELRDLFNSNERNDYQVSIVPSDTLKKLSASQNYWHLVSDGNYVSAPRSLDNYRTGDLRLHAVYSSGTGSNMIVNGKTVKNYSMIDKHSTQNVHILRRGIIYLRLAEALNRAGYPRFAFQILKTGVNNRVIENDIIPYYPESSAAFLRSFDFPNTSYILESSGQQANTIGLHSRGCGYAAADTLYVMPDDSTITDSLARQLYQIEKVEDLIMTEEALELAFEGFRFYDLMRVALRRNDPAYLANRVARRDGVVNTALLSLLQDSRNWYLKIE